MCFAWFCIIGGTALDLELSGAAGGDILEADLSAQLFETVENLFTAQWVLPVATLCVVLLITYLVTSADSAVLVINTIVSGGAPDGVRARHIVLWSVLLGLVITSFICGRNGRTALGHDYRRPALLGGDVVHALRAWLRALERHQDGAIAHT